MEETERLWLDAYAALTLAEEEGRSVDALDALSRLAALVREFPRPVWSCDDTACVVKHVTRVIEKDVMPLAGLASNVLFEEQMAVKRRRRLAASDLTSVEQPQRLRVIAAEALARRARTVMKRLSSQCLRVLKQVIDPVALSTSRDSYEGSYMNESGCLYHRMHVPHACVCACACDGLQLQWCAQHD
jgi:hypothetical protein